MSGLLGDPCLVSKMSTIESEKLLHKICVNPIDRLENGAKDLLEAISLTKKSIKQSLDSFKSCDSSVVVQAIDEIKSRLCSIEMRLEALDGKKSAPSASQPDSKKKDDFDLFGSDEEANGGTKVPPPQDAKQNKKKGPRVQTSVVVIDVKPLGDEVDMGELEELVRKVSFESLIWGESKLVPVAYGIKKLTISCKLEDEKVDMEELENEIMKNSDHVQSVDVVSFNKGD